MATDPYRYFRVEALELHAELGRGVLDLEKPGREPDLVPRLLRQAHTLKGAARVVKQREIADHAHALEDALGPFRNATSAVSRDVIDTLLELLDGIGSQIAELGASADDANGASPKEPGPVDEPVRAVRASVAEMNTLLDGIGEVHRQLGAVRGHWGTLDRARQLVDLLVEQLEQLSSSRAKDGPRSSGNVAVATKSSSIARDLQSVLAQLDRGFSSGIDQVKQELSQVRDSAEQMRLVPASALFTSLERAVRDVAQAQGKAVRFVGLGGDVRLDTHVLGAVQGALLQLVRNAVAHGIEARVDRETRGKPPVGNVTLEVTRRGGRASFACRDDGRGVDLEGVQRAAQRKGILSDDLRELDAEKLLRLLLRGGLSTSRTVTEVSGRGIGLDLLREAAERLGGDVSVRTANGQGTTMELVVPLTLASLRSLVVEVGGTGAAIPLDAVRETLRVARSDVTRTPAGESIVHAGEVVPFVSLARLLALREGDLEPPIGSAVIVEGATGRCALAVDRLVGTSTVILRPLPDLAPSTDVVAGASIDESGNPRLVLDANGLCRAARSTGLPPRMGDVRRRRVLVIDDSLTTRMLEQSILESAGYEVDVATSGEEALEKARVERYALFLVDVEMPKMDGFSFIEQTRADASLREIPSILVTSRAEPEDRRRGKEVGAKGHIVKGEFNQNDLLAQIRELLS